jgi:hypothetical protein
VVPHGTYYAEGKTIVNERETIAAAILRQLQYPQFQWLKLAPGMVSRMDHHGTLPKAISPQTYSARCDEPALLPNAGGRFAAAAGWRNRPPPWDIRKTDSATFHRFFSVVSKSAALSLVNYSASARVKANSATASVLIRSLAA